MKKIGITGGVGSGKSRVLEYLAGKGMKVYQADLLAHQVQEPGTPCYDKICAYFGKEICAEKGIIDRKKLGAVVFADESKLEKLNQIMHPAVESHILELMDMEEKKGTEYFVLEAALLHTKFYRDILDEIWYIHVAEDVRKVRLQMARGYTDEKTASIIKSQPSEEMFYQICNRVIENGGEFEKTIQQLEAAINELETGDK